MMPKISRFVFCGAMDSKTGDSQVQFLVPKGLVPGTYHVTVVTKMGPAVMSNGFTIN